MRCRDQDGTAGVHVARDDPQRTLWVMGTMGTKPAGDDGGFGLHHEVLKTSGEKRAWTGTARGIPRTCGRR